MRSHAAPRRDAAGNIIRWYGTVEDIDDRKKAEQSLRESEALLRAVFDAVPVGLIISESPGDRIIMCNPRAEAILRHPIAHGESIDIYRRSNLFHADGRAFEENEYPVERALRNNRTTDPEDILYRYEDGTQAWIRVTAAPVRGRNGGIAGAVLAIEHIYQAKQDRQKLLDRIAELEQQLKQNSSDR
jgi:PAS domain S-box-containing protein